MSLRCPPESKGVRRAGLLAIGSRQVQHQGFFLATMSVTTLNRPAPDLWSAAGALLALQNQSPELTRVEFDGAPPLSFAQERLWTLEQSEPGAPYYHIPLTWNIRGKLNVK